MPLQGHSLANWLKLAQGTLHRFCVKPAPHTNTELEADTTHTHKAKKYTTAQSGSARDV